MTPPPPQKKKKKKIQFWDDPKMISTISSYPKTIHFDEKPKKYLNSKFWTPKNGLSLRLYENMEVPYPPPP